MTNTLAVLFSGGGRTAINLLDKIECGNLDAKIVLAIASKSNIMGINRLQNRGIKVDIAENTNKNSKEGDERVRQLLNETQPDIICLCGYLRLLSLESWMQSRVLNIHPSLLPKYGGKGMYGMRVHQTVLDNNEIESGCTVHYVDEKYDHGPHIIQRSCPVLQSDTAQDLADRVFKIECDAYPEAIRAVGSKLRV